MAAAPRRTGESLVLRLWRFWCGRNPLRRRVDRIESVIVMVGVLVALLVVPLAAAVGTAVGHASDRSWTERRDALTQVRAELLEDTDAIVTEVPSAYKISAKVGWTDSEGWPHEGRASVLTGTKKGAEVTVWIDGSGAIVPAPPDPSHGKTVGTAIGISAALMGWLLLAGTARLAVVPLNRRRLRDWEAEWEHVEPRWRNPRTDA